MSSPKRVVPTKRWTPDAAARYLLDKYGVLVVERFRGDLPASRQTSSFGGHPTDLMFRYTRRATKAEWDRQAAEWRKHAGKPMPKFEARGEAWIMEEING